MTSESLLFPSGYRAPIVDGKPVPWVTMWSAEHDFEARVRATPVGGQLRAEPPGYIHERGYLWVDTPTRRLGRPLWGDVHRVRQAACMDTWRPRCQVCGLRLKARPVDWLVPTAEGPRDDIVNTLSPPVCSNCVQLATTHCPVLGQGAYRRYRVAAWSLTIFGKDFRTGAPMLAPFDEVPPMMVGKQYLAHFEDFEEVWATKSGRLLTRVDVDELAAEAEQGYDLQR
jgi:hypothetical protein